jgi:hypothetical protein
MDKGFNRNAVLRAIHATRDEDVNTLAMHMSETHYDESPLRGRMLRELFMTIAGGIPVPLIPLSVTSENEPNRDASTFPISESGSDAIYSDIVI